MLGLRSLRPRFIPLILRSALSAILQLVPAKLRGLLSRFSRTTILSSLSSILVVVLCSFLFLILEYLPYRRYIIKAICTPRVLERMHDGKLIDADNDKVEAVQDIATEVYSHIVFCDDSLSLYELLSIKMYRKLKAKGDSCQDCPIPSWLHPAAYFAFTPPTIVIQPILDNRPGAVKKGDILSLEYANAPGIFDDLVDKIVRLRKLPRPTLAETVKLEQLQLLLAVTFFHEGGHAFTRWYFSASLSRWTPRGIGPDSRYDWTTHVWGESGWYIEHKMIGGTICILEKKGGWGWKDRFVQLNITDANGENAFVVDEVFITRFFKSLRDLRRIPLFLEDRDAAPPVPAPGVGPDSPYVRTRGGFGKAEVGLGFDALLKDSEHEHTEINRIGPPVEVDARGKEPDSDYVRTYICAGRV